MGQCDGPFKIDLFESACPVKKSQDPFVVNGYEPVEEVEAVVQVDGACLSHGPYFIIGVRTESMEKWGCHYHVADPVRQIYYRPSSHFSHP